MPFSLEVEVVHFDRNSDWLVGLYTYSRILKEYLNEGINSAINLH